MGRVTRRHKKPHRQHRRRPVFTREYLLDWIRKKNIQGWRGLKRTSNSYKDPCLYDYLKEFGSWSAAKEEVYGPEFKAPCNKEYLIKLVIAFDLWSKKSYFELRKKRPDIVPSYHSVMKVCRYYSYLLEDADKVAGNRNFDKYLELAKKLDRPPNKDECKDFGIYVHAIVSSFSGAESKRDVDAVVRDILNMRKS